MRDAPYIQAVWQQGGPFLGDQKPHTRVTVQLPWDDSDTAVRNGDEDHVIHPNVSFVGNFGARGIPVRWYQKADNSQVEVELPNIKSVATDRSIETDAATCQITLYNQWMYDNGAAPVEGDGNRSLAGFFNATRGVDPEAQARWGHETNEWEGILTPNAILRTYQGYGGHEKTLAECLDDGNLILTGIWLVDEVRIATNGEMNIDCRDMGKLLVEQQLFPPLVPADKYPLSYYRWSYNDFRVRSRPQRIANEDTSFATVGDKRTVYSASSSDIVMGSYDALVHGHKPSDTLDDSTETMWLSEGYATSTQTSASPWIEYECGEYGDVIFMRPWLGNLEMYVSVMENGVWVGANTIPYTVGSNDIEAGIPYVVKIGVPNEGGEGHSHRLPRKYNIDKIRLTFRSLKYSGLGPDYYRAGVREAQVRDSSAAHTEEGAELITPLFYAGDALYNPADLNAEGYITASHLGQIDAFGDLRILPQTGGDSPTAWPIVWIELTETGDGYRVLRIDGSVTCYGNATFYGSPRDSALDWTQSNRWASLCRTPTGLGYWLVKWDGTIVSYGDAAVYAAWSIPANEYLAAAQPMYASVGLWAVDTEGTVYTHGSATDFGDFTEIPVTNTGHIIATYIVPTTSDAGYWILTSDGRVQSFGDAEDFGQILNPSYSDDPAERYYHILPTPTDNGFLMFRGNGAIAAGFGDAFNYGGPVPGSTGQLRMPGNYLDYADIIKDLALWAGFNLYDEDLASNAFPLVFGNIETTGSYARDKLPDEIFDKRPIIDAMTEIKEVVGYILFVDDEGGLRFESPNFWNLGNNVQETGERVDYIQEIDERVSILDYSTSTNDESLRSLIIISSEDPTISGETTVTTKIVPQTAIGLRGLMKPAMWINGWFQDEPEQRIMAELISMHIWFAQRLGQVTCVANPSIQVNDQVRIYERVTDEVFLHYVRAISTNHDLDSGSYTMTLTTHWLGSGDDWAIVEGDDFQDDGGHFVVTPDLKEYLVERQGDVHFGTPR